MVGFVFILTRNKGRNNTNIFKSTPGLVDKKRQWEKWIKHCYVINKLGIQLSTVARTYLRYWSTHKTYRLPWLLFWHSMVTTPSIVVDNRSSNWALALLNRYVVLLETDRHSDSLPFRPGGARECHLSRTDLRHGQNREVGTSSLMLYQSLRKLGLQDEQISWITPWHSSQQRCS